MQATPITHIYIPDNRIRREFNEERLSELASSIESKGLMHPIVLRHNDKLQLELVAGERRLRAMSLLHDGDRPFQCGGESVVAGTVPYTMVADLDPMLVKEAELEENIVRVDISWQEKAAALSELHKLRQQQTDGNWSIRNTTEEATGDTKAYNSVLQMVRLADHMDQPEVAEAETPAKAMRALRKKAAEELEAEFAKYIAETGEGAERVYFHCCDGLDAMQNLEDIDVILTDPPYGIDAQNFNNYTSDAEHEYDDSAENFMRILDQLARSSVECAAERAHLYMFCDIRHFAAASRTLSETGVWRVWPWPIVWVKDQHGLAPDSEHAPARSYETILFANKGNKPTTALYRDVITCGAATNKIHAAQKPVALLQNLLKRSGGADLRIVDPFVGSGSSILAARSLGAEIWAYEIDRKMYESALLRVNTEDES